jgi:hypothetical protein
MPEVQGTIPQARNEEQATGLRLFLSSIAGIIDFGREADRIARLAKSQCSRVSGDPGHTNTDTE